MKILLLIAGLLVCSPCAHAIVYKCIGEQGRTSYQASACVAGVVVPIDEYQPPVPPSAEPPVPRLAESAGSWDGGGRGAIRSQSRKNQFKSFHPCPANGNTRGPCPGYVVDHIKPLACGGADDPGNMQWQSVVAGKAKDAWERIGCQRGFRRHVFPSRR